MGRRLPQGVNSTASNNAGIIRSALDGDEHLVITVTRKSAPALAVLALVGLHMLAIGSSHDHDLAGADDLAAPHPCFLCQVSSNVVVDAAGNMAGAAMPAFSAPAEPPQIEPKAPLISTCSARSPPSL